ncbi:regulatory protein RecX [Oscillospiraceae bacterium NTUH-002-81]|nr:regulatory protein RecX [Oscillospiraceae bacterium NTUH-002-81]
MTKIEPVTRSKSRIYVDERRWCTLYNKELYRYSLREGQPVSDGVYGEIMGEVLTKRAKRRVLYLLRSMDRTEQQLRQKLKEGDYPEEIIDIAIAYVQKLHYQDDRRYASNYVDYRKKNKSRLQLKQELYCKGIPSDMTKEILEEYSSDEEREAIRGWLRRKGYDPAEATPESQRKMYGFLMRKGFRMEDVLAAMRMEQF